MDMQTRLFREYIERGFTPAQAWGAVANLQAESGLDPGINEINPVVAGSRGGFGLNQWTGPRRRAFEAYMAERGLPLDDIEGQMDFTFHEFNTTEKAAYDRIKSADTPEEAAYAYSKGFLRPGHDNTEYRMRTAAGMAGGEYSPIAMPEGGDDGYRQYAGIAEEEEEEDPYKPPPIFGKQHAALTERLGGHRRTQGLGRALSMLGEGMMA
jgi:hypothetical protein